MIHGNCTRRRFLAGAAAAALPAPSQSSKRPNILFLLADDQRWDALGCMGNRIIRTPVIDRLAAEGVTFYNNFCATAICMTSRASIFTGQLEKTHGVSSFQRQLSADAFARTYPALLRKTGYRTGFIGKFGLGGELPAAEFDYFKGFPGQGKYVQVVNGKTLHLSGVMGDQALEFLEGSLLSFDQLQGPARPGRREKSGYAVRLRSPLRGALSRQRDSPAEDRGRALLRRPAVLRPDFRRTQTLADGDVHAGRLSEFGEGILSPDHGRGRGGGARPQLAR